MAAKANPQKPTLAATSHIQSLAEIAGLEPAPIYSHNQTYLLI